MLNVKSVDDYANLMAHELANLLPMTSASEFANLKADIVANGLLQPIWLFEGRILDGRNRYRACQRFYRSRFDHRFCSPSCHNEFYLAERRTALAWTAEVALTRMFAGSAQATEADHARAMDATIRAMARDRYTNPNALRTPETTKVANAPDVVTAGEAKRGSGWQEEKSLPIHSAKGSREEALIDAMVEKFVGPPGGEKKDRK